MLHSFLAVAVAVAVVVSVQYIPANEIEKRIQINMQFGSEINNKIE